MTDAKIKFDDIGVTIGQAVEVLPFSAQSKSFSEAIIVGAIPGESLIIIASKNNELPTMKEGEKIIFKVKLTNGVAIFATNVLFIADIPTIMVYVDIPKDIAFKKIRSAPRVFVSLPVLASGTSSGSPSGVAGKIVDISTTGVGLELFEALGNRGDVISLKGKFTVGSIQRILSVRAIIRKAKESGRGGFLYGVEIIEEDENHLLVLFGFIFNAMVFGNIQKIR